MRWTLAQAGLALFTSGTMGIAQPALAQTSPCLPYGTLPTIIEGTNLAPVNDLPPAPKPISMAEKTIVLPASQTKPRIVSLSDSGDASPHLKVVTLPVGKSAPTIRDQDKPVPSGGVPVVIERRTTEKRAPKTNPNAIGDGAAFAEARSTGKPSNNVEPVGRTSAPVAKTPEHANGSYVAPGVISYEEIPTTATTVIRADPFICRLKERIGAICGDAAKNVEIHALGEKRLMIRAQCATREEGERLSRRILQLRELAPYAVSLDMKLVP
jgi:hypothetical protein